jgi:hypothetical protein
MFSRASSNVEPRTIHRAMTARQVLIIFWREMFYTWIDGAGSRRAWALHRLRGLGVRTP